LAALLKLLTAMNSERTAVRSFVGLLQQEQRLLTEGSIEPLLTLAEQKSDFAVKLNALSEERLRLLRERLPVLDNSAIQSWFEANSPEGLLVWQEIRMLAEQASELNRINGELIQMKLRYNQQSLAALNLAVSKAANLYGPDGQTSFSPGSGRTLASA
jgi:flagella synthesis protein FlgN